MLIELAIAPVPPIIQSNKIGGLEIAYPQYAFVAQNASFEIRIHVYNGSMYMTNATTSCFFELYNSNGRETLNEFMLFDGTQSSIGDFYVTIAPGNFSNFGYHSYIIGCNSTMEQIGFINGIFEINKIGHDLETPYTLLYLGFIGILFLMFIIIPFGIAKLPSSDVYDDDNNLIGITKLKYLRPVLWGVEWLILLTIFFVASNVAIAYLPQQMFGDLLFTIYRIMFMMTLPMIIIWFIYIFHKAYIDVVNQKLLNRGAVGLNTL